MKKVLVLSIILAGGLTITGTILAESRHTKPTQTQGQTSRYYCNAVAGTAQGRYMSYDNMRSMMYSKYPTASKYNPRNAPWMMYPYQCTPDSSYYMGRYMMNGPDTQSYHQMMQY